MSRIPLGIASNKALFIAIDLIFQKKTFLNNILLNSLCGNWLLSIKIWDRKLQYNCITSIARDEALTI